MIDRKLVHGAVYCISHKGRIIAHGSLGRNNALGEDTPMQPDTVFGITEFLTTLSSCADITDISVRSLPMDMIITRIYTE